MQVRSLTAALNGNGRFKYKTPQSVVDHLVVGGGVVGLAIAQRLSQQLPAKSTFLVERHPQAAWETSSRNSEVIHSGLYYPTNSLKTRLCLRGRQMLYERCETQNIPYRKTGKLVVATEHQRHYIENLHAKAMKLKWPHHPTPCDSGKSVLPTNLISGAQVRELEPNVSNDIAAGLWCPETGIIDSHSFVKSLEKDIIDSEGSVLVYSTRIVRVDPHERSTKGAGSTDGDAAEGGWVVQTVTDGAEDSDSVLVNTLINASGLSGPLIVNAILPEHARIPMYYAKGSYATYSGPGVSGISRLIYPCSDTGKDAHAFQSLGTHLTLDLQGGVRFGPDIEWISPPSVDDHASEADIDFWTRHLTPDESRLSEMHQAVVRYLPEVILEGLQPGYVGIRPKLVPPGGGFQDFVVRTDYPHQGMSKNERCSPLISLLGIESPGLTASLAIAELVVEDILQR